MSDSFEERGDAAPDTLNTTIEAAIDQYRDVETLNFHRLQLLP